LELLLERLLQLSKKEVPQVAPGLNTLLGDGAFSLLEVDQSLKSREPVFGPTTSVLMKKATRRNDQASYGLYITVLPYSHILQVHAFGARQSSGSLSFSDELPLFVYNRYHEVLAC
jgi:hypothetical protein